MNDSEGAQRIERVGETRWAQKELDKTSENTSVAQLLSRKEP